MGIYFLGFAAGVLLWAGCATPGAGDRRCWPACAQAWRAPCAPPGRQDSRRCWPGASSRRWDWQPAPSPRRPCCATACRARLTRCFIMLGAVLSWSPALGPLAASCWRTRRAFAACWVASRRWPACCWQPDGRVGETRTGRRRQPMRRLAGRMLRDGELLCTAMLVAGLNLLAFSFYAAGPFMTGPLPWLGSAGSAWPWRWPAPSARYGTGACRPRKARAAGGAGPALRGGRRGGAGIGNLARAHARRLVGRGRAAHLRRLRPGHPNLLGPALRATARRRRRGCFRLARAAGAGLGGVALAGLHRLRGRLS